MHFAHGVSWDACSPGVVAPADRYTTRDHVITQSCTICFQWLPLSPNRIHWGTRGGGWRTEDWTFGWQNWNKDFKNIRMIKYWYILFLICETVFIQAVKYFAFGADYFRFPSIMFCALWYGCNNNICLRNGSADKFDTLQWYTWCCIHTKIFRVALIFFRRVRETVRSN